MFSGYGEEFVGVGEGDGEGLGGLLRWFVYVRCIMDCDWHVLGEGYGIHRFVVVRLVEMCPMSSVLEWYDVTQ